MLYLYVSFILLFLFYFLLVLFLPAYGYNNGTMSSKRKTNAIKDIVTCESIASTFNTLCTVNNNEKQKS